MTSHFRNSLISDAVRELAAAVALSGFTLSEVLLDRVGYTKEDPIHYTRTVITPCGVVRVHVPA